MARIALSEDLNEAELLLSAGEKLSPDAALALLERIGVKQGILADSLAQLPELEGPASLVVARGLPAMEGVDAQIDYMHPHRLGRLLPLVVPGDNPDFLALGKLRPVKAGAVLARRTPPVQPVQGWTVTGHMLQPAFPRDALLQAGPGATVSEDGLSLVATIDGLPYLDDSRVTVRPELRVTGNVAPACGHIQFDGDITILGSVMPQMEVRATGRILVLGDVVGARLAAGDDIVVRGYIRQQAMLESAGGVFAMGVEATAIRCQFALHIQKSLISCNVEVNDALVVGEDVVGGNTRIGRYGTSHVVGSHERVPTKIWVLPPVVDADRLRELESEQAKIHETLTRLAPKLQAAKLASGGDVTPAVQKMQELIDLMQQREAVLIERKRSLSQLRSNSRPRFDVRRMIHPEVALYMGSAQLKLEAPSPACSLIEEAGEIRQVPLMEASTAT